MILLKLSSAESYRMLERKISNILHCSLSFIGKSVLR